MNAEFDKYSIDYNAGNDVFIKRISGRDQLQFLMPKVRLIQDIFSGLESPLSNVLDFGCGTGDMLYLLQKEKPDWNVLGIDVSNGMLEKAKKNYPEMAAKFLKVDNGRESEIVGESKFDLVVSTCVFHHISPIEWRDTMRRIRSLLRPGSHFLLIEHNPWNPVTRWIVANAAIDKNAVLISLKKSYQLLKNSGYEVSGVRNFMFLPPRFSFAAFVDNVARKLPFGGQYAIWGKKCP
jgi:SAM-dependent methyltransferase